MKLGIIGLPQSGKSTIFKALTGARGQDGSQSLARTESAIATIMVPDVRVDDLSALYKPKKTIYARIEYLLPSALPDASSSKAEGGILNQARPCDALLHVVPNFNAPDESGADSQSCFRKLEEEMVLADLVVTEKRIERIDLDRKRGKKHEGEEYSLLQSCRELLEKGTALRQVPELAAEPLLKGFTFLSAKPSLVIMNNGDEDEALPEWAAASHQGLEFIAVRGLLEEDIASMSSEEAEEFLEAYNIKESALDRVIGTSYRLLNRISFFTVGSDEVRAWPIADGTPAVEAAGEVHSDIQKGFIRAEVLAYDDLVAHGTPQNAKKAGLFRLEGKEYRVKDGDIITFRFNV